MIEKHQAMMKVGVKLLIPFQKENHLLLFLHKRQHCWVGFVEFLDFCEKLKLTQIPYTSPFVTMFAIVVLMSTL
jgi:hypothetical protein